MTVNQVNVRRSRPLFTVRSLYTRAHLVAAINCSAQPPFHIVSLGIFPFPLVTDLLHYFTGIVDAQRDGRGRYKHPVSFDTIENV